MFRLWSTPVHRWLFSCVHRPIADYHCGGGKEDSNSDKKPSCRRRRRRRRRVLGMTAAFVFSSAVHEAVTYVAMRRTCWPFNTFCLVFAAVLIPAWDALYPVVSEITEAGDGGGELAQSPPLKAAVSTSSSPSSSTSNSTTDNDDHIGSVGKGCPPVRGVRPVSGALAPDGMDDNMFVVVGRTYLGGGGGDAGSGKKKAGSKWRGWGAVAFFMGASLLMGLAVDFLAWQWWRHSLLR